MLNFGCPVCGSSHLELFFEMLRVPIYCNLLWPNQKEAIHCPRGDIKLAFCPQCSFITNIAFDPSRLEYTQAYENSLDFSPLFQDYARSLAERLVNRHHLYQKDIIEIGCGKGDFLLLLCEVGNNRGVGFDPSYIPQQGHEGVKNQITFIQDIYSERYADYKSDFICSRQMLEHIQNPTTVLNTLRRAIGPRLNTVVFFEVPNGIYTFRKLFIWDIIYEHCTYFTPVSLARAFSACGFRVRNVSEEFDGQFLSIEAVPSKDGARITNDGMDDEIKLLAKDIASFTANFEAKVQTWKTEIEKVKSRKQRAIVWGAGSKGVTFLNALNIRDHIEYVVDINPRKQGMYIAGTGQEIVSSNFLRDYQPDVVIVMNPIYKNEIENMIRNLKLNPNFVYV